MFLKLFLNAMIKNIKIHNIFDIIGVSKSIEPNKCIHKNNFMEMFFKCFLWFFKVQWVQENQGVTFLMVPPKDRLAQKYNTFTFGYKFWFLGCTIIIFTNLMLCKIIFKIIINFIIEGSIFIIHIGIIGPLFHFDYTNFKVSLVIKIINFNEIKKIAI
jgi:hypothetical protein